MTKKYIVNLTEAERDRLHVIIKKGKNTAKIRRAHILLAADASAEGKQMNDEAIHQAYSISIRSVERLRQRFVWEGFDIALNGKPVEPRSPRCGPRRMKCAYMGRNSSPPVKENPMRDFQPLLLTILLHKPNDHSSRPDPICVL